MERDPHQLIEGVLIACYAIGPAQAFLYVRGEMALAQERIAAALNDAYAAGYIGKNILGSDFSVDVVLHWGAGAYIVGEETALIESLEGNRGMPRLKPPFFPAAKGLYLPAHDRQQRRDAREPPVDHQQRRRQPSPSWAETSQGMRLFAVSGHVATRASTRWSSASPPSATSSRPAYGGDRDGRKAQGVHPRRRLGAVVLRGAPRPPARAQRRRPGGLDARLRRHRRDGRRPPTPWAGHGSCGSSPGSPAASARPAARGPTGWRRSCAASSTATAGPTTSRCCSTSATTSAPGSPGRRSRPRSARSARAPSRPSRPPSSASRTSSSPTAAAPTRSPVAINGKAYSPLPPRSPCLTPSDPTDRASHGQRQGDRGRRASWSSTPPSATAPTSPLLLPPADGAGRHVPDVHRRDRHRPGPALQPACMIPVAPGHEGRHRERRHQEGAGRGPRVPPDQPPARLPGVRQGRRVPAAGPDAVLRAGREPVRRGEAALRQADHDQRPRGSRPRALHPLRPLHPVRQGGRRRHAHPLPGPGQPDRGQHLPRPPLRQAYFSGNTVQICPVGALTATPYRFKARPVGPRPGRDAPAPRARSDAAPPSSRAATRSCATRASTSIR